MTDTTDPKSAERLLRRDAFLAIYEGLPGTHEERAAKVCAILGYRPHTIRVLRCRTQAYKVIPAAKLEILRRELQREAQAQPATA